ncbi:MAG: ABC transporter substrate-binding protein [Candidatus Rokubacteria bacterium]|nr:ABC transporter substrate-binding protein [Candidatus Rokubacteria bacterium]
MTDSGRRHIVAGTWCGAPGSWSSASRSASSPTPRRPPPSRRWGSPASASSRPARSRPARTSGRRSGGDCASWATSRARTSCWSSARPGKKGAGTTNWPRTSSGSRWTSSWRPRRRPFATAPAIQAARRATRTIPIVMATSADAVRDGLVASLSRPGGNVTGLSMLQTDLSGKRVELLREIAPGVSRLAVLLNPASAQSVSQLREVEAAARALGVVTVRLEVSRADQLERALRAAAEGGADSLIVLTEPLFYGLRARVAELALKHRLPATAPWTVFAEAGGLVSYGASDTENYRRAAAYVDKILKGAKPADLPVEQPTVFDLGVNLKTARALGLTIPPSVLARADRVIE